MLKRQYRILFLLLAAAVTLTSYISCSKSTSDGPWSESELMKPADLAAVLNKPATEHPLILQIGFQFLYKQKHIPGSIFAGPAGEPEGIQRLHTALANTPKDGEVVIYCGCCPWTHCPNIHPAYAELKNLGYTNIRVLETPENLKTDWIDKGYPTESGEAVKQ